MFRAGLRVVTVVSKVQMLKRPLSKDPYLISVSGNSGSFAEGLRWVLEVRVP